jgi:N-acetylmuramic acid 6-phosphate etherase
MEPHKVTESDSHYSHLEKKSTIELIHIINAEDAKVANAVEQTLPEIADLVEKILPRFLSGGRLFYIGAGTSGRLGILDASEIPPTYGLDHDRVIGLIAGGDSAIRKAVEFAEDNEEGAWIDLSKFQLNEKDTVVGITASGTTPYVLGGIKKCRENNILTAGISCNPNSPLSDLAEIAIEAVVGPEVVTGSTRMKSGTAQKMILNLISTTLMIRAGLVLDNKMVNMQLSNNKLWNRGVRYIVEALSISREEALEALNKYGSVQSVLNAYDKN